METVSLARVVQCFVAVNEKHGVVDVVFLTQFRDKRTGGYFGSRRFKPCVELFIR